MASGVISIWQLFDILLLIGTGGLDVAFVLVNRLILTSEWLLQTIDSSAV